MRAPRLRLHASLCLIGAPHVMRRPASVNMGNICVFGHDAAKGDWANLCGKAMFDMRNPACDDEPFYKRASGACPGNGWGA